MSTSIHPVSRNAILSASGARIRVRRSAFAGKLIQGNAGGIVSTLVEELTQKARLLPPEERVRLAEELLATVQEVDSDVEAAWDQELRCRIAEIDGGTAKLIPAEDVFAEVRRLLE